MLIDNLHFNNKDVIFYTKGNIAKIFAGQEAKLQLEQAGYTVVDMSKMAINLKRGFEGLCNAICLYGSFLLCADIRLSG